MSDNTPTERFTPITAPSPTAPLAAEDSSRRPLIILISVAGALLIAVIILMIVLFTRGGDAPFVVPTDSSTPTVSASPTPTAAATSATPTPAPEVTETEEAAPPPPPTGPIQSFTVSTTSVDCDGVNSVPLHFEWAANGVSLWFGVGVNDAKAAPYGQYELTDELDIDYQCGQTNKQQKYTVSVQTGAGDTVSQSITVKE